MSSLFGQTRNELLGANIDFIFPALYSSLLFQILEEIHSKQQSPKEQYQFFGKSRIGYIFPCFLKIVETPSFSNKFTFIILILIDKNLFREDLGFMLLDKDLALRNISSTCITLGLSKSQLYKFQSLTIKMLFKNLGQQKLQQLFHSEGIALKFAIPNAKGMYS